MPFVESQILQLVVPEGLSHIVHGSADCARSQSLLSARRIFFVADGLGEACKEFCSVGEMDGFKEEIVVDVDCFTEGGPSGPSCSPLFVRRSLDGVDVGIFCSHAERNKSISRGSGAILKDCGSCEGK